MTETTKPVLTRAQKYAARIDVLTKRIEKDTAELAEVKLEQETSSRLASVAAGSIIEARLGRAGSAAVEAKEEQRDEQGNITAPAVAAKAATAGTLRIVTATVTGVKEEDNGSLRYKITFGSGFDQDVEIIQASQIVSVQAGEAAPAEALPAGAVEALYAADGVGY